MTIAKAIDEIHETDGVLTWYHPKVTKIRSFIVLKGEKVKRINDVVHGCPIGW